MIDLKICSVISAVLWCMSTLGCISTSLSPMIEQELKEDQAKTRALLDRLHPTQLERFMPDSVCAQCHPRQAKEFEGSTMRYGFISPVFNALELSLNQLSQGRFSHRGASANFCAQCHGPRAISEGLKVSDRRVSRDFIPLSKTDAELSKTDAELSKTDAEFMGIGCDICHSAPHPQPPSQGLRSTPSTVKVGPNLDPAFNFFHTYALGTRGQEARLWLQSSDFCGSCHDVRPRQPDVERGDEYLRTEDLFTEWERSPWADPQHPQNPMRGQTGIIGVHDGREREGEQVTCQDCHMSLYPYRGFEDQIYYKDHFSSVPKESLSRKVHKLYPVGQIAQPLMSTSLKMDEGEHPSVRRVSTHHFTGVSQPLVPYPLRSIFELNIADPLLEQEAQDDEQTQDDEQAQDDEQTQDDEQAQDDEQRTRWVERWRSWRTQEDSLIDDYGRPLRSFRRRIDLLKSALSLLVDDIPRSVEANTTLSVPLWIENIGAGHHVPAGFSQEREVWVSLVVEDDGRPCERDLECEDLIETQLFLNDPNQHCVVHTRSGAPDPVLPEVEEGMSWEEAARRERSGRCGSRGYCQLYRSGYLIDHDGDGLLNDEDLRHQLIEINPQTFEERCVLNGPDADLRLSGVERGLIWFTNALQRVAIDEQGRPIPNPKVTQLTPTASPYNPFLDDETPVFQQDQRIRRSLYPTQRARFERAKFRPAPATSEEENPRQGFGLTVPHLLLANRAFNGESLPPFEPRLALYEIPLREGVVGPLYVKARVRFRFFSPRLLRTLAARHPQLVYEEMIDVGLEVIDLLEEERWVEVRP